MKNILISIILTAGLTACVKENKDAVSDKIYFKGITKRNDMGELISNDTSDCRFDDKWSTKEDNLFSVKYKSSDQKCTTVIGLYPNPIQDIFRLYLTNPAQSRLSVRLVNKDFKVIFKNDSIFNSQSSTFRYT